VLVFFSHQDLDSCGLRVTTALLPSSDNKKSEVGMIEGTVMAAGIPVALQAEFPLSEAASSANATNRIAVEVTGMISNNPAMEVAQAAEENSLQNSNRPTTTMETGRDPSTGRDSHDIMAKMQTPTTIHKAAGQ
jgi:hypothetical protein